MIQGKRHVSETEGAGAFRPLKSVRSDERASALEVLPTKAGAEALFGKPLFRGLKAPAPSGVYVMA